MRKRLNHLSLRGALLVLAFGLAACGDGERNGGGESGAVSPAEALIGMDFLLESSEGYDLVEGSSVSMRFQDDGTSGKAGFRLAAGCNSIGGEFSLNDAVFTVHEVFMTEMACEATLMAQDDWFLGFITEGPTLALDGGRLTLTSPDASLVFIDREAAVPDRALLGSTWTVDTFVEGAGASGTASAINVAVAPTVVFGEDGTVEVFTGCNSGSGGFVVEGTTLSLGPIGYTRMACSDESQAQVEGYVQEVLNEGELSFEIDATRLHLDRGDVGLSAFTD